MPTWPCTRRLSCTHGDVRTNVGNLTSAHGDVDPETGMPTASGVAVTVERLRQAEPGALLRE